MKKITLLCIAFMAFAFSFKANAQCDFTLELTDTWGDGWNGVSTMDVYVGGVLVFDDIQAAAGAGGGVPTVENVTFTVNPGDDIYTVFNPSATQGTPDWAQECFYRILDNVGNEVGAGDSLNDITTGTISAVCLTCTPPTVTIPPDPIDNTNCPATVDVSISIDALGDSTTLTVSGEDDLGNPAGTGGTVSAIEVFTITNVPVPQTGWSIIVEHETDPSCNVVLGPFVLECPPLNDDFANAEAINCGDTVTGSTFYASIDEVGAPDVTTVEVDTPADNDSPNVWYSFMGTGDRIILSTCNAGSSFDTEIMVFTGSTGALTLIDDAFDECGAPDYFAETTFVSVAATQYYISVEGWDPADVGNYELTITCIPNDECSGAIGLTLGEEMMFDNTGATDSVNGSTCNTGDIRDLWYSFDAPASGEIDIVISGAAAHYALFSDCANTLISCDTTPVVGLSGGTTYYIAVTDDGTTLRVPGASGITVSDATLSNQDFDNELAFSYYPNPVNDILSLNAQRDIQNIAVYNMLGQEVLRTAPNADNTDVNVSALQSGAYFVKVTIEDVTETVRIIKN